jgi:anti-anti-sigma regulatory factor
MSSATTIHAHIAYELIEDTNYQVVVIEFLSQDIASPTHAQELREQLHSLLRPQQLQYFVIDCADVRSLGSTAFSAIADFVRKARPVWVCNLANTLRFGASLVGLDNWARFAADRRAAIEEAERTALWEVENPVRALVWTR